MFILILTGGLKNELDTNIEFSRSRADTINAYYESFKDYSRFVFEMSAKACVDAISFDMIQNTQFYSDEDSFFEDIGYCMLTGNVTFPTEHELGIPNEFLVNNIFRVLTNLTKEEYKINTNYNITNISVTSYSPLEDIYPDEFKITAKINIEIYDKDISLSPSGFQTIVNVKLNGMYDPLYSIETTELNRINDIIIIGKNDDHLRELTFNDFLDKVDYIQYFKGVSIMNRILGNSVESNEGLVYFLNRSLDYGDISYVDIHYMNSTYFSPSELFCEKSLGACVGNFKIDSITFAAMKTRYGLDTTGWERVS